MLAATLSEGRWGNGAAACKEFTVESNEQRYHWHMIPLLIKRRKRKGAKDRDSRDDNATEDGDELLLQE